MYALPLFPCAQTFNALDENLMTFALVMDQVISLVRLFVYRLFALP